jgi:hypothetical protein
MLSSNDSFSCGRAEALRDFAFDELPAGERQEMEQHIRGCGDCATELDRLRVTTSALRILPDREIPQRIAFVSDEVLQPSLWSRFWNSGARLGFASACVLGVAMLISAWRVSAVHPPAPVQQVTASVSPEQIQAAVAKAVAKTREADVQLIQAAVASAEKKRDEQNRAQLVALAENLEILRKTSLVSYTRLNASEFPGAGQ